MGVTPREKKIWVSKCLILWSKNHCWQKEKSHHAWRREKVAKIWRPSYSNSNKDVKKEKSNESYKWKWKEKGSKIISKSFKKILIKLKRKERAEVGVSRAKWSLYSETDLKVGLNPNQKYLTQGQNPITRGQDPITNQAHRFKKCKNPQRLLVDDQGQDWDRGLATSLRWLKARCSRLLRTRR